MNKILVFFLVLIAGNIFAQNTIIAVVNNIPITLNSIQNKLLNAESNEGKIDILNAEIDTLLQLQKVNELNLKPTKEEIEYVIIDVAKNNNITVDSDDKLRKRVQRLKRQLG